jgi:dihydroorotase
LDKLEGFASLFGPDFYQLPRNEMQIVLQKEPWEMPAEFQLGPESVVPINASGTINWRVSGDTA